MNDYKEYKNSNGESIFVVLNSNDMDVLKAQKQIAERGYIIMRLEYVFIDEEKTPIIKARKAIEEWSNPAYE